MKTFLKIGSLFAVLFSIEGCVAGRVVRQDAAGNTVQVEGKFLTTAQATNLLRTAGDVGNEHDAIQANGENGYAISVGNTNGGVSTGYAGYGYGGSRNSYAAALDDLDAAQPLKPQTSGSDGTGGGSGEAIPVWGVELKKDVRSVQEHLARTDDEAVAK